jgi:hypothetical protein
MLIEEVHMAPFWQNDRVLSWKVDGVGLLVVDKTNWKAGAGTGQSADMQLFDAWERH